MNLRPLDPQCHIWRTRVFSDIPSEQFRSRFGMSADTPGQAQIECRCYPRCYPLVSSQGIGYVPKYQAPQRPSALQAPLEFWWWSASSSAWSCQANSRTRPHSWAALASSHDQPHRGAGVVDSYKQGAPIGVKEPRDRLDDGIFFYCLLLCWACLPVDPIARLT